MLCQSQPDCYFSISYSNLVGICAKNATMLTTHGVISNPLFGIKAMYINQLCRYNKLNKAKSKLQVQKK